MRSSSWLRGLTARMLLVCGLLVLAFAVVFTLLLTALHDLDHKSQGTRHSMYVLALSAETQNSVSDMVSAATNYVQRGGKGARPRYEAARAQVLRNTAALEQLVRDNPTQFRAAVTIEAGAELLVRDWAGVYVEMVDEGQRREAARLIFQDSPRSRIAALRGEFEDFNRREEAIGSSRAGAAHEHAHESSNLLKGAFAGLLAVVLVLLATLSRGVVNPIRRMAHAARRLALGDLDARVPENSGTEVGDLSRAFNYMVASVRGSRESLETQNAELEAQQLALERALDGLAEQKQRVERLHRFAEDLASETRLEALSEIVLAQLTDFIGAEVGTLYALDGDRDVTMALLSSEGLDRDVLPEELLPGEGLAGRAIVERRMITASFGEGGLRMTSLGKELVLAREMHVPLMQGDQTVGVVTLGTSDAQELSQARLEQLAYLAGQAAVALSNAIALRRARTQAAINRAVLESTREAFVAFDESGQITAWNPAAEWLFGRSRLEAIGLDVYDTVVPARDREMHREGLRRFLTTGDAGGFDDRIEITLVRRDGREFPAVIAMSQLELGGRRVFNAFLHDVTRAKLTERYTHTQYEVSRALAASGSVDVAGPSVLTAMGEGFRWQFGTLWAVEDDGGMLQRQATWASHSLGAQACAVHDHELAKRASQTGELITVSDVGDASCEDCAVAAGGGLRAAIAVPLEADGGVAGAVVFYAREMAESEDREFTSAVRAIGLQVGQYIERKRIQRAADRMKDGFLALVSHELRTPLTSIVGYLELLVEDEAEEVSPTGRQFLGVIDRNARRLQRLVDDVLFAAQAEAGRMSLDPGHMDLYEVASESVDALRPTAVERGIDLKLGRERLPAVRADRDRVGQAIDNLVSNALKFTPPGGSVDVRLRSNDGVAVVEVSDTGLGMSEEDRQRVFDRFFRAGATRDSAPGVGLGLTIVKAIAEGHGGNVSVESEEGVGTTFRIELPLEGKPAAQPSRR
jgi:PAS domain S-box-containing protein